MERARYLAGPREPRQHLKDWNPGLAYPAPQDIWPDERRARRDRNRPPSANPWNMMTIVTFSPRKKPAADRARGSVPVRAADRTTGGSSSANVGCIATLVLVFVLPVFAVLAWIYYNDAIQGIPRQPRRITQRRLRRRAERYPVSLDI